MPLELGVWLGAKRYGGPKDKQKRALVLDRLDYRYQVFCSDIAGQDPRSHNNDTSLIIRRIRNWLRNSPDYKNVRFPSAEKMISRYAQFRIDLPALSSAQSLNHRTLEFNDYSILVAGWLKVNPPKPN